MYSLIEKLANDLGSPLCCEVNIFPENKPSIEFHKKFGFVDIVKTNSLYNKKYISNLGIDALSPKLKPDNIYSKISKSHVPIKQILLNQKIIAGIGNIYASEILFATNISPTRLGKDVSYDECKKILQESKKILSKAIKAGGTTLNDYFNAESKPGYFKIQLKVYGRDGQKCSKCESNILKITQSNRSTYFCKESQN